MYDTLFCDKSIIQRSHTAYSYLSHCNLHTASCIIRVTVAVLCHSNTLTSQLKNSHERFKRGRHHSSDGPGYDRDYEKPLFSDPDANHPNKKVCNIF